MAWRLTHSVLASVGCDGRGDTLAIRGERKADPSAQPERYHRRERVGGAFARSVVLGNRLDPDKTEASQEEEESPWPG